MDLDDAVWLQVCRLALEEAKVGVIACDAHTRVLGFTALGGVLLERFGASAIRIGDRLPDALARAADQYRATNASGDRAQAIVRVETPDRGLAAYISFCVPEQGSSVSLVVLLRREVLREEALSTALQARYGVSARELQIISLVRQGFSNKQIADSLGLAPGTVKNYLVGIFQRLEVSSRTEMLAVVEAIRTGQADARSSS